MVYINHAFLTKSFSCILYFNPFALRKTQIAYNFGLSGCKRVKYLYHIALRKILVTGLANMVLFCPF